MRFYVKLAILIFVLAITPSTARALDVTFSDATGATDFILDNGPGDLNPALGVIDFRRALFLGLTFSAFGRVEEIIAGQSVTLRITEISGTSDAGPLRHHPTREIR